MRVELVSLYVLLSTARHIRVNDSSLTDPHRLIKFIDFVIIQLLNPRVKDDSSVEAVSTHEMSSNVKLSSPSFSSSSVITC